MTSNAPTTTSAALPFDNTHKLVKHKNLVPYVYTAPSADDLERAHRMGNFPTRPSNLFLKAYSDVMQSVQIHPGADIVAPDLIATSGIVPLTINAHYDSLLGHYHDSIVNAQTEILFAAGFWKVGKATTLIVNAFRELNNRIAARGGPKVIIKIMWYRGVPHWRRKNTPEEKQKLTLPTPTECPFLDFETMDMHQLPLGVFHVKFLIVDKQFMMISSTNIQGKPNVELSVHTEGRIVDSFYSVFCQEWNKEFVPPLPLENVPAPPRSNFNFVGNPIRAPCIYHTEHDALPMFLANKQPQKGFGRSHWDAPQNIAWLSLMHNAQRNIVIQTPDFNAGLAITAVLQACKRDVHVTIMLSWVYNALKERFFQGGTNVHVIKGMYKKLMKMGKHQYLTVCFYVARSQMHPTKVHPNHTKFMAVDDTVAIFGSGNMDTQSWHHSMETNIAVDSPLLVKEWLELFKISQNTHLYGTIDPTLAESPVQQIRRMLAKNNTQPTHVNPAFAPPPFINNSQMPIHNESEVRPNNFANQAEIPGQLPPNPAQSYNNNNFANQSALPGQLSANSAQPFNNNNFANQSGFSNGQIPLNSASQFAQPYNSNLTNQSALPNGQLPMNSASEFAQPYNNNLNTQSALPNGQLPLNSAPLGTQAYNNNLNTQSALPNGQLPINSASEFALPSNNNFAAQSALPINSASEFAQPSYNNLFTQSALPNSQLPINSQNGIAPVNGSLAPAQSTFAPLPGNEIPLQNNYAQNNMTKEVIPPAIPTTGYPSS